MSSKELHEERRRRTKAEIELHNYKQNRALPIFLAIVFGIIATIMIAEYLIKNYRRYQAQQQFEQSIQQERK